MGKEENFKGNTKATQFPHNDPTKGGRKVSIRNQLKKLLDQDGRITIPSNQIEQVKENGDVVMKLPTQDQLAMKLISWAMNNKGINSLKAIQMVMEQIDGKPKQEVEVNAPAFITFDGRNTEPQNQES